MKLSFLNKHFPSAAFQGDEPSPGPTLEATEVPTTARLSCMCPHTAFVLLGLSSYFSIHSSVEAQLSIGLFVIDISAINFLSLHRYVSIHIYIYLCTCSVLNVSRPV